MNEVNIIQIIATVGIWIVVIWFGVIIKNLGRSITAQKDVIESLKTHLESVQIYHDTVRVLYEPREIIKLISVKVENERLKYEEQIMKEKKLSEEKLTTQAEIIKSNLEPLIRACLMFIAFAGVALPEKRIQQALSLIQDESERKELQEYITSTQQAIREFTNQQKVITNRSS